MHQAAFGKFFALLIILYGFGIGLPVERATGLPGAKGCTTPATTRSTRADELDLPPADFVVTVNGSFQWVVNGTVNPTLTLTRGQTYLFDLAAFSDEHPFVINLHASDPFGPLLAGPAFGQTISFTPDMVMPSTLYYHCVVHYGSMAGAILLEGASIPCTGDMNGDQQVNSFDFAILANTFGISCTDCPADLNDDGAVNSFDFAMFVNEFGNTCF